MTRELIENFRRIILPYMAKRLLRINYEGLGKDDAKEFTEHFNEILDLAIKALEQQPEDAISRQDTLKTTIKHLGIRSEEYLLPAEEAIYKVVKNMPPIQPEPTECEDTISRQGLIDFLKGFEILHCNDELRTNLLNGINSLSPVYPKIKIGHWIHLKHNKGKCSECHDVVLIAQMYGNANYCPNCGAKMIEPQESKGKE